MRASSALPLLCAVLLAGCDHPGGSLTGTPPAPATQPVLPLQPAPAPVAEKQSPVSAREQAAALLAAIPTLPPEELNNTAARAVEALPDADYAAVAEPVLLDRRMHGQVLSVLFADLLERPDAVALPTLLRLAKDPHHPYATAALDDLRLLLGTDWGTDWPHWEAEVRAKLVAPQ